ncbi:hypothetical protein FRC18_000001 [Serendipita sp. 400]|nr:hypothetical protein FRC18_000001 [Serendipita sp. 400]
MCTYDTPTSDQHTNLSWISQPIPSVQALLSQLTPSDERSYSRLQEPIHANDLPRTSNEQSTTLHLPNRQPSTGKLEQSPVSENWQDRLATISYRHSDDISNSEHKTQKMITKAKIMRSIEDPLLRKLLIVIFASRWWNFDEVEPEAAYNALIETCGDIYKCRICNHEKTRWDRALAHIRKHVEHRPFVCFGRSCSNGRKCTSRFFTKECLSAHQKSNTVVCHCGAEVIPKNLSRHQRSLKCREAQTAPQSAETVVD